jgi:hypothetical protein
MSTGEETGTSILWTAVVGDQATEERFAELTSGTSRWQQGLVATCKDSSNEAKAEGEESRRGWGRESVGAMNGR